MIVLVMEKIPRQLRGYISRFLMEIKSGVFIGDCSQRVRDGLWEKIKENEDVSTSSILIWSDKNREQGFDFVTLGYNRECDMDGFVGMVNNTYPVQSQNTNKKKGWSKAYRYRHFG